MRRAPKHAKSEDSPLAGLLRLVFFAAAVLLGFSLIELPWNEEFFQMEQAYVAPNLAFLTAGAIVVYLLGQRTRTALVVFVALCLLVGTANHYVVQFKGQPIVPADLFALSTAASVSSGYDFMPDLRLICCFLVAIAYAVLLYRFCPKTKLTIPSAIVNCLIAAFIVWMGGNFYEENDIGHRYDVTVDVWDVRGSYASQGTLLCFLTRTQELTPTAPDGYSVERACEILAPYNDEALPPDGAAMESGGPAGEPAEGTEEAVVETTENFNGPNVIVVMNETFTDLSIYSGLENTNAYPSVYHEIAGESLAAGSLYVSALGGGTCNTEFELLTGASTGNMGGGVYPYVLYDLDHVDNLAAYFRNLGYDTSAIHPAEANNWRRDVIYSQLGFDSFDDIETMRDCDTFRNLVTDKATYERALEKIEAGDGPQFIFDVTIQNHGGYESGLIPAEDQVELDSSLIQSEEVNEFLSCLKRSEADLRWFIDELNALDEPTVVVFFGDHQPGFADWLFETCEGKGVDESTLAEVQQRFTTPYFIWANKAAQAEGAPTVVRAVEDAEDLSTNFLGSVLIEAAGLPQTPLSRYMEALRAQVPALNLNGYMTSDGAWHWFDQVTEASDDLEDYRMVQYANLFEKNEVEGLQK